MDSVDNSMPVKKYSSSPMKNGESNLDEDQFDKTTNNDS